MSKMYIIFIILCNFLSLFFSNVNLSLKKSYIFAKIIITREITLLPISKMHENLWSFIYNQFAIILSFGLSHQSRKQTQNLFLVRFIAASTSVALVNFVSPIILLIFYTKLSFFYEKLTSIPVRLAFLKKKSLKL